MDGCLNYLIKRDAFFYHLLLRVLCNADVVSLGLRSNLLKHRLWINAH